jgi:hypothetical protein
MSQGLGYGDRVLPRDGRTYSSSGVVIGPAPGGRLRVLWWDGEETEHDEEDLEIIIEKGPFDSPL